MFGMGWSEMLVVGIVALIVVGPKDLPGMFRTMGEFTGKAKGMAREFNRAMSAAADEAGVKDISKTINAAANPKAFGVDKLREATKLDLDPESVTGKLSAQREANKAKILANTAKAAEARKAEAAAAAPEATQPETKAKPKAKPKAKAKAAPKSEASE